VVAEALKSSARAWDRFATEVNAHGYPVDIAGDLAYAVVRLTLLDTGLRWGTWVANRLCTGKASPGDRAWLEPEAVRDYIDEKWSLRSQEGRTSPPPHRQSDRLLSLAEAAGVSERMVQSWRKDAIPES